MTWVEQLPRIGPGFLVTFTCYPKGLDVDDESKRVTDTMATSGQAIRWIRCRMRESIPLLAIDDQEAVLDWLDDSRRTFEAKRNIAAGELFEYVTSPHGMSIQLTALRMTTR